MSWRFRSSAYGVLLQAVWLGGSVVAGLVTRQLDATPVAVRVPFDVRAALLHQHLDAFFVPTRFAGHMMVVADLCAGDDGAVEDAGTSAWLLQTEDGDVNPGDDSRVG